MITGGVLRGGGGGGAEYVDRGCREVGEACEVVSRWLFVLIVQLTVEGAGAEASGWRVTPMRLWISSLFNPLLSRKDIFLSVDALRTSSSSRNFLACSTKVSRLGD